MPEQRRRDRIPTPTSPPQGLGNPETLYPYLQELKSWLGSTGATPNVSLFEQFAAGPTRRAMGMAQNRPYTFLIMDPQTGQPTAPPMDFPNQETGLKHIAAAYHLGEDELHLIKTGGSAPFPSGSGGKLRPRQSSQYVLQLRPK